MGLFLILFLIGGGIGLLVFGLPAFIKLLAQLGKVIYALFVLLPIQIVRVIQGKPPVDKKP